MEGWRVLTCMHIECFMFILFECLGVCQFNVKQKTVLLATCGSKSQFTLYFIVYGHIYLILISRCQMSLVDLHFAIWLSRLIKWDVDIQSWKLSYRSDDRGWARCSWKDSSDLEMQVMTWTYLMNEYEFDDWVVIEHYIGQY